VNASNQLREGERSSKDGELLREAPGPHALVRRIRVRERVHGKALTCRRQQGCHPWHGGYVDVIPTGDDVIVGEAEAKVPPQRGEVGGSVKISSFVLLVCLIEPESSASSAGSREARSAQTRNACLKSSSITTPPRSNSKARTDPTSSGAPWVIRRVSHLARSDPGRHPVEGTRCGPLIVGNTAIRRCDRPFASVGAGAPARRRDQTSRAFRPSDRRRALPPAASHLLRGASASKLVWGHAPKPHGAVVIEHGVHAGLSFNSS
jgi:hypothetical protein